MSKKVKRVGRVGTRRLFTAIAGVCLFSLFLSCSATSKISVKQSQGEQVQETEIETNGKLDNLSLSFINSPIVSPSKITALK